VKRNRAKRLLRAAASKHLGEIVAGHDILLVARKKILTTSSQELENVIIKLLSEAKLLSGLK